MVNKENVVAEFLSKRRSVTVAKLADPGPSPDILESIIEIGLRVPDHGVCGPWRVQVIRKDGQSLLGDFYADIFTKENPNATDSQIDYWRSRPQTAPILLVVSCYPQEERFHKAPLWEQTLSGGAVCQNILNGVHAYGFSGQWITEWPAYNAEVKKFLGHNPGIDFYGFIFIGTALEYPSERRRVNANEVVSEWP